MKVWVSVLTDDDVVDSVRVFADPEIGKKMRGVEAEIETEVSERDAVRYVAMLISNQRVPERIATRIDHHFIVVDSQPYHRCASIGSEWAKASWVSMDDAISKLKAGRMSGICTDEQFDALPVSEPTERNDW